MMRRPRLYYTGWDDEAGAVSMTADEVVLDEPQAVDTGLLDAAGQPIKRLVDRAPLGFHIERK